MSVRRTITFSNTEEQDALLRDCPETGRFGSITEVVRAAPRLLDREEAQALRAVRATRTRDEALRG